MEISLFQLFCFTVFVSVWTAILMLMFVCKGENR